MMKKLIKKRQDQEKKKILIAEDNDAERLAIKEALQKEGYEVFLATNGKEALDILKTHQIDLLLLDGKMPVMDGTETIKQVRRFNKKLHIVMLTAYPGRATHVEVILGKIDDFLVKPYNLNDLMIKINSILYPKEKPYPGVTKYFRPVLY